MIQLALNYNRGYMAIKDIIVKEKVSKKYIEKILNNLKSQGLVKTSRGIRGGYKLSIPPDKIRVRDIFEALNESILLVQCLGKKRCQLAARCVTREIWAEMSKLIEEKLHSLTLAQLANRKAIKEKRHA